MQINIDTKYEHTSSPFSATGSGGSFGLMDGVMKFGGATRIVIALGIRRVQQQGKKEMERIAYLLWNEEPPNCTAISAEVGSIKFTIAMPKAWSD
jgi:hypothetical protein